MNYSGYAPFVTIKEREMPFYIMTIGNPKPQTEVLRPFGIPDYMFLYTVLGEGRVNINGTEHELKSGSFMFVPPGSKHEYKIHGDRWETLYITFNGEIPSGFLKNETTVFTLPQNYNFSDKYNRLFELRQNPQNYKRISIELYSLILDIHECMNTELSEYKKGGIVDTAIKLLSEKSDINEIAAKLDISVEYFCRIFKKHTGYRPVEYSNILKIQRAKGLLNKTDKSIAEITKEVGYESQSYFGMLFKKYTGITPTEYRNIIIT